MGNAYSSSQQIAEELASDFLLTAVVVDDEVTYSDATLPKPGETLQVPTLWEEVSQHATTARTDRRHDLNARTLTDEFAELGLVCSVLPLDEEGKAESRIRSMSRRSDVIVLDWMVRGNPGDFAIRLIKNIIADDADPDWLRLIAIYTAEVKLDEIAQAIAEAINVEAEGSTVTHQSLRVRVFSKREYPEENLPEEIIREFARMIDGLLPTTAVAGLAELRKRTYRLIGRFSRDLDAAYWGQRMALIENPAEAEQHLEHALSGEIQSLLEDCLIGQYAGLDACRAWVTDFEASGGNLTERVRLTGDAATQDIVEFVCELLNYGRSYREGEHNLASNTGWKRCTRLFTRSDEDAECSNQRFAALLALKHHHGEPPPRLWSGTILAEDGDLGTSYWLCVQPRCDSTGLSGSTRFPLLPLHQESTTGMNALDSSIFSDQGTWHKVKVSRDLGGIRIITCNPDQGRREVIAIRENGTYYLYHSDGKFRWVGELKAETAQRAANKLAAQAARVGVAESIWLTKIDI
ncbi:MAG: response regulator receiver domain [Chloroflexi bacterium]|nr:response regulator receiver domain [Chloroflexota bacterium]